MATKGTTSTIGEDQPTDESKSAMDDMVNEMIGSPSEETKKPAKEVKEEVAEEEESQGLEAEETEEEVEEEEGAEEPKAAEASEEEETTDEVIPASKVKKIQEKMQKRIDELTRKLNETEVQAQKKNATQEDKLEVLSPKQLQDLRENVDESILDLKVSQKVDGVDISEKLAEYRELKRNIDMTIKNAPRRFQKRQLDALEAVIEDVKEIDPEVVNKKGNLWKTASTIYSKMPSLSRTETGMAEAMAMAAEHLLNSNNVSSVQGKVKNLNQTVTKLKQKTSLSTNNKNIDKSGESFKKLKSKAVNGTEDDKVAFVGALIADDFLAT